MDPRFSNFYREISPVSEFCPLFLTGVSKKGVDAIANLILEELKTVLPELATYVKVARLAEQVPAVSTDSRNNRAEPQGPRSKKEIPIDSSLRDRASRRGSIGLDVCSRWIE